MSEGKCGKRSGDIGMRRGGGVGGGKHRRYMEDTDMIHTTHRIAHAQTCPLHVCSHSYMYVCPHTNEFSLSGADPNLWYVFIIRTHHAEPVQTSHQCSEPSCCCQDKRKYIL